MYNRRCKARELSQEVGGRYTFMYRTRSFSEGWNRAHFYFGGKGLHRGVGGVICATYSPRKRQGGSLKSLDGDMYAYATNTRFVSTDFAKLKTGPRV